MMSTAVKVILYIAILAIIYCDEHSVPVVLHVKRVKFLADWKLAAWAQKNAIKSYQSYQDEAEYVRG